MPLAVRAKLTWLVIGPVSMRLDQVERRLGVEHLRLADVLEREPHLLAVRRRRDVRAERAFLLHLRDDLVIGDGDDVGLRIERRADVAVFAVGREDLHARAVRRGDAGLLRERLRIEHGDIVLAAHGDPDFLAVGREERLVRRAADIGHVLHRIGRGVDEGHRIRADRDHRERPVIRRVAHAVHQHLPLVERAEIAGLRDRRAGSRRAACCRRDR